MDHDRAPGCQNVAEIVGQRLAHIARADGHEESGAALGCDGVAMGGCNQSGDARFLVNRRGHFRGGGQGGADDQGGIAIGNLVRNGQRGFIAAFVIHRH